MSSSHSKVNQSAKILEGQTLLDAVEVASPGALKKIRPQQRRALSLVKLSSAEMTSIETHYSGPLPPAEILADYEKIAPGTVERIITMAENQASHRIAIEKTVITSQLKESTRGQLFGFIISIVGLGFSSLVIYAGHDVAGASMGTASLVALAGVFVYGKHSQKRSLQEKRS